MSSMSSKSPNSQEAVEERYKLSYESYLGVKFGKYNDGYCDISLAIEDKHLNIGKSVHGGVINALCDIALSGAVTCTLTDTAKSVVTLQMNVNFLRAGMPGDTLTAYGEIIKRGRTICYVEGGIKNQDGKLIARASGDWFIKN